MYHTELERFFSPITYADFAQYRSFFLKSHDVLSYGNGLAYITQACRSFGKGLKHHSGDLLLSLGQHNGHYVIVRPLGVLDQRFIELLALLRKISQKPVYVKKLFADQVVALKQLAEFNVASEYDFVYQEAQPGRYVWDECAYADDDTYPELILQLDVSLAYSMELREWFACYQQARRTKSSKEDIGSIRRGYSKLRSRARKFQNLDIQVRVEEYSIRLRNQVYQFLHKYFGKARSGYVKAYENMLDLPEFDSARENYIVFGMYLNNAEHLSGFFFAERIGRETAGLYAGVAAYETPGMAEYLKLQAMVYLQKQGIRFLNLGGAETKNLHRFKRKFAPIEERCMNLQFAYFLSSFSNSSFIQALKSHISELTAHF